MKLIAALLRDSADRPSLVSLELMTRAFGGPACNHPATDARLGWRPENLYAPSPTQGSPTLDALAQRVISIALRVMATVNAEVGRIKRPLVGSAACRPESRLNHACIDTERPNRPMTEYLASASTAGQLVGLKADAMTGQR
jgi:hypothetical protein